jgi:hypothetical protein
MVAWKVFGGFGVGFGRRAWMIVVYWLVGTWEGGEDLVE